MQKHLFCAASVSGDSSSDEEITDEDLVLHFTREVIDTRELLQPFEGTKRPRRRKRKEKSGVKESTERMEDAQGA